MNAILVSNTFANHGVYIFKQRRSEMPKNIYFFGGLLGQLRVYNPHLKKDRFATSFGDPINPINRSVCVVRDPFIYEVGGLK